MKELQLNTKIHEKLFRTFRYVVNSKLITVYLLYFSIEETIQILLYTNYFIKLTLWIYNSIQHKKYRN